MTTGDRRAPANHFAVRKCVRGVACVALIIIFSWASMTASRAALLVALRIVFSRNGWRCRIVFGVVTWLAKRALFIDKQETDNYGMRGRQAVSRRRRHAMRENDGRGVN